MMPLEWALIAGGLALLLIAARPIQRLASRSSEQDSPPAVQPSETPAPVRAQRPTPTPQPSEDPLEMPWLDSLLGTPARTASEPLDDAAEIANVLRFWLSEERP